MATMNAHWFSGGGGGSGSTLTTTTTENQSQKSTNKIKIMNTIKAQSAKMLKNSTTTTMTTNNGAALFTRTHVAKIDYASSTEKLIPKMVTSKGVSTQNTLAAAANATRCYRKSLSFKDEKDAQTKKPQKNKSTQIEEKLFKSENRGKVNEMCQTEQIWTKEFGHLYELCQQKFCFAAFCQKLQDLLNQTEPEITFNAMPSTYYKDGVASAVNFETKTNFKENFKENGPRKIGRTPNRSFKIPKRTPKFKVQLSSMNMKSSMTSKPEFLINTVERNENEKLELFLNDFNNGLLQVVEANDKLKTMLHKSKELLVKETITDKKVKTPSNIGVFVEWPTNAELQLDDSLSKSDSKSSQYVSEPETEIEKENNSEAFECEIYAIKKPQTIIYTDDSSISRAITSDSKRSSTIANESIESTLRAITATNQTEYHSPISTSSESDQKSCIIDENDLALCFCTSSTVITPHSQRKFTTATASKLKQEKKQKQKTKQRNCKSKDLHEHIAEIRERQCKLLKEMKKELRIIQKLLKGALISTSSSTATTFNSNKNCTTQDHHNFDGDLEYIIAWNKKLDEKEIEINKLERAQQNVNQQQITPPAAKEYTKNLLQRIKHLRQRLKRISKEYKIVLVNRKDPDDNNVDKLLASKQDLRRHKIGKKLSQKDNNCIHNVFHGEIYLDMENTDP